MYSKRLMMALLAFVMCALGVLTPSMAHADDTPGYSLAEVSIERPRLEVSYLELGSVTETDTEADADTAAKPQTKTSIFKALNYSRAQLKLVKPGSDAKVYSYKNGKLNYLGKLLVSKNPIRVYASVTQTSGDETVTWSRIKYSQWVAYVQSKHLKDYHQAKTKVKAKKPTKAKKHTAAAAAGVTFSGSTQSRRNQAIAWSQISSNYPRWKNTTQFSCLRNLWQRESGWNERAHNTSSGAHGIPQSLPASKMGAGSWHNPYKQIAWGLRYIKTAKTPSGRIKYGSPCAAWNFFLSQTPHWY